MRRKTKEELLALGALFENVGVAFARKYELSDEDMQTILAGVGLVALREKCGSKEETLRAAEGMLSADEKLRSTFNPAHDILQ